MRQKMIFVLVLLLIVMGEIAYLFFFSNMENDSKTNKSSVSLSLEVSPTKIVEAQRILVPQSQIDADLSNDGILLSAISNKTYEFSIYKRGRVENLPVKLTKDLYRKAFIMFETSRGTNGAFYFSNHDLEIAQVLDVVNEETKQITFWDLQEGDRIRLERTQNLEEDPEFATKKLVITRLK